MVAAIRQICAITVFRYTRQRAVQNIAAIAKAG
jgi:hypothetical protein